MVEGQRAQIGTLQYFSLKEKFPSSFCVIAEKSLGNLNAIFKNKKKNTFGDYKNSNFIRNESKNI